MHRCFTGLLFAAACARTPAPLSVADASVPVVTTRVLSDAGPSSSALDALPRPPSREKRAIKIVGYPETVFNGMNDPAELVGFTSDGGEYGYCAPSGGRDTATTDCVTLLADGTLKKRSTDDATGGYSEILARDLARWVASSGLTGLSGEKRLAKPLDASWAFSDLTLWVSTEEGDGTANALVRVGGAVEGEAPVYPITLRPNTRSTEYSSAWVNDLSVSKDGAELGVVAGFFCREYCNDFTLYRTRTADFVALVYNDTGFRHHQRREFARASELFLQATFADLKSKRPPFNLACAWARLNDPRAKDALSVAIERDPTAKARAVKDPDFSSVKDAPWFHTLTD